MYLEHLQQLSLPPLICAMPPVAAALVTPLSFVDRFLQGGFSRKACSNDLPRKSLRAAAMRTCRLALYCRSRLFIFAARRVGFVRVFVSKDDLLI